LYAFEDLGPQRNLGVNSDKISYPREQYNPRPTRRRSGIEQDGQPTRADIGVGTAKRKRQKTDRHHDAGQDDTWDSDKIGAHRENYKPRPSRRRSRAVLDAGDEDLATPGWSMPVTSPPGRGDAEMTERAEPVLISSGQPAPQEQNDLVEGIDPSYLAALPEDLRQEVIADQLARNSQIPRTRGRGRPSQRVDGLAPLTDATAQPAKRGRKKKTETPAEDALDSPEEAVPEIAAVTTPVAGKNKRGRPRKSEARQLPQPPAANDDTPLAHEAGDMPVPADRANVEEAVPRGMADAPGPLRAPSNRGRKRKVIAGSPAAPEEESSTDDKGSQGATKETKATSNRVPKETVVEGSLPADDYSEASPGTKRKALADISNTKSCQVPADEKQGNAGTSSDAAADMQTETTPEVRSKDTAGSASSTTKQQGKVPLRVGLSKKSRIAPLLKIIRK
jgi:hypothetical protein